MSRLPILAYGVFCYLVFLATFVYAIGFLGNFGVPRPIDAAPTVPLWPALAVDTALLLLFAVQHSVMARPAFKRAWTRLIPPAAERSTYVLLSSLALIALFLFWQPVGGDVWQLTHPLAVGAVYAVFAAGWALLLASTFLIDHFDLFGLRQVWQHFGGQAPVPPAFRTPGLYRHVRHPIYVGWLLIFWATPTMTVAHLLFAVATTVYMLVAIRFEEHDLKVLHPEYADYRRRVPALLPRLRRPRAPA